MKTIELLREGVETSDGRLIQSGATWWPKTLPVQNYRTEREYPMPLGHITNIRRLGSVIVGDCSFNAEALSVGGTSIIDRKYSSNEYVHILTAYRLMYAQPCPKDEYLWKDGPMSEAAIHLAEVKIKLDLLDAKCVEYAEDEFITKSLQATRTSLVAASMRYAREVEEELEFERRRNAYESPEGKLLTAFCHAIDYDYLTEEDYPTIIENVKQRLLAHNLKIQLVATQGE